MEIDLYVQEELFKKWGQLNRSEIKLTDQF